MPLCMLCASGFVFLMDASVEKQGGEQGSLSLDLIRPACRFIVSEIVL